MHMPEAWLTLSYNMHGNERLGAEVACMLDGHPGIIPVNLHPAAAEAGKRMLGTVAELGSQWPGDDASDDPEALAAAQAKCDLERAERVCNGRPFGSIITDVHCTEMSDACYAGAGELVLPEALALVKKLGRRVVQWLPDYPFFQYHPNAIAVDATVRGEHELTRNALLLAQQIGEVARLGLSGLTDYFYESGIDDMTFYKRVAYIQLTVDGRPNTPVLNMLPELEANEVPGRYARVHISEHMAEAIGVKPGWYNANTWGYRNMSSVLPSLPPTAAGTPRRACFGDLLVEVGPPARLSKKLLYFGLRS